MSLRLAEKPLPRYEGERSHWDWSSVSLLARVKFSCTLVENLHQHNVKYLKKVYTVFEKYYPVLLDVKIQLQVLVCLVHEKNVKFAARTTHLERMDLSAFRSYYCQSYWQLYVEIFNLQATAQRFSHLVQRFQLSFVNKKCLEAAPVVFRKEVSAFQQIKQVYHRYAEELNKKMQKVAEQQIEELVLLKKELGLYEKTVNKYVHVFSQSYIPVEQKTKELKICGKHVHNPRE